MCGSIVTYFNLQIILRSNRDFSGCQLCLSETKRRPIPVVSWTYERRTTDN